MSRLSLRSIAALCGALACMLASAPLHAHDIVLVPSATGAITVRYGHPGDWQPIDDGKLIELQVIAGEGAPVAQLQALRKSGLTRVLPAANARPGGAAQPVMVAARYDNGIWSRMAAVGNEKPKARNASRLMLPDAERVTANVKFAKAIFLAPGDESVYRRRLGHLLELVPQRNPASLKAGDALPVLLLLNGQPLANAGIEVSNGVDKTEEDRIQRYTTDAAGMAQVVLRPRGINTLAVDVDRENDGSLGPQAKALGVDRIVMIATYTFVR